MIKSLRLKNFQSHENTELEFCDGINAILGESLSGKTAIIRALLWLFFNRPSGFRFHSDFDKSGETRVEVKLSNEVEIFHEKTSGGSVYGISADGQPAKIFSSVGQGVPDIIQSALNIREINISEQLDKPFLIADSASEIGKVFNRITKAEQVDSWILSLTSKIGVQKKISAKISDEILSVNKEVSSFDWIDSIREEIISLKALDSKVSDVILRKEKIYGILLGSRQYLNNKKVLSEINKLLSHEPDFVVVEEKTKILSKKELNRKAVELVLKNIEFCFALRVSISSISEELGKLSEKESRLKIISDSVVKIRLYIEKKKYVVSLLKEVEDLSAAHFTLLRLKAKSSKLSCLSNKRDLIRKKMFLSGELLSARKDLLLSVGEYKALLLSENKCPVCLSIIDSDRIEIIVKELL